MRKPLPDKIEAARVVKGIFASPRNSGPYGAFDLHGPCGERLLIIAADTRDPESEGWEHVSVSIGRRLPNWKEMAFVKDLFWDDQELVAQFHPPRSEYVNNMENCLHLWRHKSLINPPSFLVGDKIQGVIETREQAELAERRAEKDASSRQ
jgi:hypothetical protein